MRALLRAIAALVLLASALRAESPPTLIADRIFINADTTLTAEGAVEVFFEGTRLRASRITYDSAAGTLTIEGPITLTDSDGSLIVANEAQLSRDLRDGVMTSARLVMQDQLQLAANELRRVSGRYTQLGKVVASSCQVCPSNPTPLWEIRARRVVHDQLERQLYFDHAQFRVAGLPVFYIPRLRMPDPTLDRATGFLQPLFRSSSELGLGVRIPYFIAIGDSRDLTLSPYVAETGAGSLFFRYRQAFRTGSLQFDGGFGRDKILPDETRGYLFGTGAFALPAGYTLGFQIETVTDDAYLLDYGITDKDRLGSGLSLTRTRRDRFFDARLFTYRSLRSGDDNSVLPSLVGDLSVVRRVTPDLVGGQATLRFDLHGLRRSSAVDVDASGDGVTDGRDMARATLGLDWRRQSVLTNGMVLGLGAAVRADVFAIAQDAAFPGTVTRFTPSATVDLRWPWVRAGGAAGAVQVIEPVAQLVWTDLGADPVPNEDSALVEFDEGNLFGFSRFPGSDIYEDGLRANLGVSWKRLDPAGWTIGVTAGRVLRSEDLGQFSTGSGLSGTRSDWLLAVQLLSADGLSFTNRALFDDGLDFSRDEFRLSWTRPRFDLGANYVWLTADPSEGRPNGTSELAFDASWQISDGWRGMLNGRYDFAANRAAKAGIGLQYANECALVDLSLSRRYTSSTSVRPTTEISLSVALNGFGTGADGRAYRRSCTY